MKNIAKQLGENLTDEELQEMIDEADMDGDGEVNEAEFFRMMKKTEIFWITSITHATHTINYHYNHRSSDASFYCFLA